MSAVCAPGNPYPACPSTRQNARDLDTRQARRDRDSRHVRPPDLSADLTTLIARGLQPMRDLGHEAVAARAHLVRRCTVGQRASEH
jgi:hypothetical protein